VIDRRGLLRALARSAPTDWVLVHREQQIGVATDSPQLRRAEQRLAWRMTVHQDTPAGRGSAQVTIESVDGSADAIVEQTRALALASIGPTWASQPLAAPARVELEDKTFGDRAPTDIAAELVASFTRPAGATVVGRASVTRENVSLAARAGLRAEWAATSIRADVLVAAGDRSLPVAREARRLEDLAIGDGIRRAAEDLALLATAGGPKGGPCAVVLAADALLHEGLGVWTALVTHADAVIERQGLTRYRERTPIAPGADTIRDPLTVISDGALDHGVRSAPVGDDGDGIRRFKLVERGIAAGLGLSPREAALRKREPNGGVRNLDVALGLWDGVIDASDRRVIEVRRLRSLSIDPYTGDASLEIALGIEHPKRTAFSGGSLRIDLIAALAHARRSGTRVQRGAYRGPDAIQIERAELIA
jgi:hypothetical protein